MKDLQLRVQHSLMFSSKFLSDVGLFNGKMGIVIAFAHLYIQSANDLYRDVMEELLNDVLDNIYKDITVGFESGISGIGWGIEYLRMKKMVESDSLCLYEEINQEIMETDIRRIADMSLETGLEGLLHYIIFLLSRSDRKNLPFDALYLSDLYNKILALSSSGLSANMRLFGLANMYKNWYNGIKICYKPDPVGFVQLEGIDEKLYFDYPLGLRKGISGWLLKEYCK